MSVLSVVSGVANAAGKAFEGYGLDQRTAAADLLAQRKAADEEAANRVRNIVALAGIDPDVQGQLSGARARAEVPAHVSEFGQEAPIRTQEAVATAQGTAPITEGVHEHERTFDNAHQPPIKPSFSPVTTTAPDGEQHVSAFNAKTGALTDTGAGAKAATGGAGGGGGGFGSLSPQAIAGMAQQAKSADAVMHAFEEKYAHDPSIVGPGSGLAASAAGAPGAGVSAGIQKIIGNTALRSINPDYQAYLAAQKRFGNIMGNLMSRRYTEHQGVLDTDLSGLATGDVGQTLALKQSYRQDLLDHFPVPAGPTAPGGSGGSASPGAHPIYSKYGLTPPQP